MTLPYRPNVGIMLINKEGKIFAGYRSGQKDTKSWQMPQGGIDENENPLTAAQRELFEETGIQSIQYLAQSSKWYKYDFPDWIPIEKRSQWQGQKQKWFLFLYTGTDAEKEFSERKDKEFSAFQWVDKNFLISHIIDFKKEIYIQVFSEFNSFLKK